jgi:uncharacterized membrane protein YvlD (DUF360 family)
MKEGDFMERTDRMGFGGFLSRIIVSAIVLGITAFFTPGFQISGLWSLIFGAIVLSVLDFAISRIGNIDASPFGRGLTGFIVAAAILYFTQYFVAGYRVTIFGALIGAVVYGIVDAIIPGKAM